MKRWHSPLLDTEQAEAGGTSFRRRGGAGDSMVRENKGDGSPARDLARLRSLRRRTGDEEVVHGDENLRGSL